MTKTSAAWRLLAISLSLVLHFMLITEWPDKPFARAAIAQHEKPPLLVQLSFQTPPKIVPEVAPPPQPVVKQIDKPKPRPKSKPKKKPKTKKKHQSKPKPKPVIAETPPPIERIEKQVLPQPAPPPIQPKIDLRKQYLAKLLAKIKAEKIYPTLARRRNLEGEVEVRFNLNCNGKVSKLTITGPHSLLRKATGKALDAAQPLPQPPTQINCPMPVQFAMTYNLVD
jgi:protein TonB